MTCDDCGGALGKQSECWRVKDHGQLYDIRLCRRCAQRPRHAKARGPAVYSAWQRGYVERAQGKRPAL